MDLAPFAWCRQDVMEVDIFEALYVCVYFMLPISLFSPFLRRHLFCVLLYVPWSFVFARAVGTSSLERSGYFRLSAFGHLAVLWPISRIDAAFTIGTGGAWGPIWRPKLPI